MPRFVADRSVGPSRIVGVVHGTDTQTCDGSLVGPMPADDRVPMSELAAIGDLSLGFGQEGLQAILLAGGADRTREGRSAEFLSRRKGWRGVPLES